jgi:hypothetical protein
MFQIPKSPNLDFSSRQKSQKRHFQYENPTFSPRSQHKKSKKHHFKDVLLSKNGQKTSILGRTAKCTKTLEMY